MPEVQNAFTAFEDVLNKVQASPATRFVLGIAAIGGAGKSTLAEQLLERSREAEVSAALVPMDGFHLPNIELDRRGLRDSKGKPETFDGRAFVSLLERIKAGREAVAFPVYDRKRHDPVWPDDAEHTIAPMPDGPQLVITEGNYLLLEIRPWSSLAEILDEAWFLDVPVEVARERIIARHIRGGRSEDDARAHYDRVDATNASLVRDSSRRADRIVTLD